MTRMSMMPHSSSPIRFRFWLGWAILIAFCDQMVKTGIQTLMEYGQSIPLAPYFNLVHVWNTGAAFSFLAQSGGWQRFFFIGIALVVSVGIIVILRKSSVTRDSLAYSLILGGAMGNLIDRIARGYVVDYLDFFWRDWHWPAFNLADVGITVGATLLIFSSFRNVQSS